MNACKFIRYVLYIVLLVLLPVTWGGAENKSIDWLENDDMVSLYEAITKISSESLFFDNNGDIVSHILKVYIQSIDEYSDYFSKEEYQAFQQSLRSEYAGIGLLLYQQRGNEKILCIPGSNKTRQLGISLHDQLLSVNGKPVKNKNFYIVGTWIRGRKDTKVILKIRKVSGEIKNITFLRKQQHFRSVQRVVKNGKVIIRIIHFTQETPRELRHILLQGSRNTEITIDLRSNGGGDFFAAIRAADLLLPKGSLIVSVQTKSLRIKYQALTGDISKSRKITLLQDNYTASAAEVFIAALTQNSRARSVGTKSYGKGVVQKFVMLSNGGAILLTYGKIFTPDGTSYNKKGLLPTSSR